jgi:hypothetical protein
MAQFRCGVAPIKVETGIYERLAIEKRLCFNCIKGHQRTLNVRYVMLSCPVYAHIR